MTVGQWIGSRAPAPPAAMTARIDVSLGKERAASAAPANTVCLDAAIDVLTRLLDQDALGRDAAIDLLAADALTTYAFEAAAADPDRLENDAAEAMVRLAALAERGERPGA